MCEKKGQREAVRHGAGSSAFPLSLSLSALPVCANAHGPLLSHGNNVLFLALWETRESAEGRMDNSGVEIAHSFAEGRYCDVYYGIKYIA